MHSADLCDFSACIHHSWTLTKAKAHGRSPAKPSHVSSPRGAQKHDSVAILFLFCAEKLKSVQLTGRVRDELSRQQRRDRWRLAFHLSGARIPSKSTPSARL